MPTFRREQCLCRSSEHKVEEEAGSASDLDALLRTGNGRRIGTRLCMCLSFNFCDRDDGKPLILIKTPSLTCQLKHLLWCSETLILWDQDHSLRKIGHRDFTKLQLCVPILGQDCFHAKYSLGHIYID